MLHDICWGAALNAYSMQGNKTAEFKEFLPNADQLIGLTTAMLEGQNVNSNVVLSSICELLLASRAEHLVIKLLDRDLISLSLIHI